MNKHHYRNTALALIILTYVMIITSIIIGLFNTDAHIHSDIGLMVRALFFGSIIPCSCAFLTQFFFAD